MVDGIAGRTGWTGRGISTSPYPNLTPDDAIDGVPLGFTDAAVTVDGRMAFIACAEDTADAIDDGPVLGCCFGWIDPESCSAVTAIVLDADGRPTTLKLEGIEARPGSAVLFDVVADTDRGDEPAQIAELSVREGAVRS